MCETYICNYFLVVIVTLIPEPVSYIFLDSCFTSSVAVSKGLQYLVSDALEILQLKLHINSDFVCQLVHLHMYMYTILALK